MIANSWPIVGITQRSQVSVDAAANSNQPEHEDRIEIGGNWHPTDNLLLSASFWIQNAYNRSEFVNFDEDSYPIILSGWYAPDDRWSFTGGYATFSNWIVQDVTLGRENGGGNESSSVHGAVELRWPRRCAERRCQLCRDLPHDA